MDLEPRKQSVSLEEGEILCKAKNGDSSAQPPPRGCTDFSLGDCARVGRKEIVTLLKHYWTRALDG